MKTEQLPDTSMEKQKELTGVALQELAGQITEADKGFVMFTLNTSIDTVRRYLKGQVANLETGMRMVQLFRQRILERPAA